MIKYLSNKDAQYHRNLMFSRKVVEIMLKDLIAEVETNNHISHAKIIKMLQNAKLKEVSK